MRIGYIQMTPEFGRLEDNVAEALELISQTEADLLVLPELFNSGYLFIEKDEVAELSERIPDGYTTQALLSVSEETGSLIAAGLPERDGDKFYNSAVLVTPEGRCTDTVKLICSTEKSCFLIREIPDLRFFIRRKAFGSG